ncbi:glycosyltransferase family 4 protein [Xanthocytophaga agilis]|uniref:Glycosyltransferase family 4 protein n=1 Tax=Xanthocytophaga agilis TaxID=3048010 RepID=A0AAE3QYU5_9BACT|nr:glycosyltransferase family 4 protein [Xanthocytophaga agilis]MDJ1499985.1 glycosyltransferase family 4 protein [Xanthocytophaga agilis]
MNSTLKRPAIFTWHIHGSYLYYLAQGDFDIYIPVNKAKSEGYVGRGETFPFGDNVHEVYAEEVRTLSFDCILFQTNQNYLIDQYEILSPEQRKLPRIYLEHDPPRQHPTNTRHVVADPDVLVVHVTHFNRLMWDNATRTEVIEHGVTVAPAVYSGHLNKGIVVINNLPLRGRICGWDIFQEVSKHIPLDLVGMGTESVGLGEVLHPQLPEFISQYRFFFNPIRYTSLGLAVCEAMSLGIPVVGLATTEMVAVIKNGINGYIHTDISVLIECMQRLLQDPEHARQIGLNGQQTAKERFDIRRFTEDWTRVFHKVLQQHYSSQMIEI